MTTDSMAQFYIDCTHENMPGWTAVRSKDMQGKNARFSVIERHCKGRTVITAFTVKGNTTFMCCVTAKAQDATTVGAAMSDLSKMVGLIGLSREDMGGGEKAASEAGL
jgi:hypothetical protein